MISIVIFLIHSYTRVQSQHRKTTNFHLKQIVYSLSKLRNSFKYSGIEMHLLALFNTTFQYPIRDTCYMQSPFASEQPCYVFHFATARLLPTIHCAQRRPIPYFYKVRGVLRKGKIDLFIGNLCIYGNLKTAFFREKPLGQAKGEHNYGNRNYIYFSWPN